MGARWVQDGCKIKRPNTLIISIGCKKCKILASLPHIFVAISPSNSSGQASHEAQPEQTGLSSVLLKLCALLTTNRPNHTNPFICEIREIRVRKISVK